MIECTKLNNFIDFSPFSCCCGVVCVWSAVGAGGWLLWPVGHTHPRLHTHTYTRTRTHSHTRTQTCTLIDCLTVHLGFSFCLSRNICHPLLLLVVNVLVLPLAPGFGLVWFVVVVVFFFILVTVFPPFKSGHTVPDGCTEAEKRVLQGCACGYRRCDQELSHNVRLNVIFISACRLF